MKKWHIAALVIVGLIVAGIAYTMYEKRRVGMVVRKRKADSALLDNEAIPATKSDIPGLGNKIEPVRGPLNPAQRRKWKEKAWNDVEEYNFDDLVYL